MTTRAAPTPIHPERDMAQYAFGDSAVAAKRLVLLAQTFAPASRRFLGDSVGFRPQLAADLGCGPGHSTHLLASVLNPVRTIGFDNSKNFLKRASKTCSGSIRFESHDITAAPFPHRPFDLLFGRFVLTHLRYPKAAVEMWVGQLRPGGILLIEEVETIESRIPAFVEYLKIQQSMLASQGNSLFVGPQLEAEGEFAGTRLQENDVAYLDVSPARAASMFHMNLAVIRDHEFVRGRCAVKAIDKLRDVLLEISASADRDSELPAVRWGLRQMVLERVSV